MALLAVTRALELKETEPGKAFFAQCVATAQFTADDNGRFRRLAHRALAEAWAAPRDIAGACISLIRLNGALTDCVARVNSAWPTRLSAAELFGVSGIKLLADDELLCCLLESAAVGEMGLERLLTSARRLMLSSATDGAIDSRSDARLDESLLGFYCALARQCFINEYVYSITQEEADRLQRLRAALEAALAAGGSCPPLWLAVIGAYFPLHSVSNADALLEKSWPQSVEALLVQQVKEPAEERSLRTTIPALTTIDNEVSLLVREQYEESPYPRWIKSGPSIQPAILESRPEPVTDVLIAGCGTGMFSLAFARHAPNARFLGIDLSLSSLSYAKRMAQDLGVTNFEFAQADIMKLNSLGRTFISSTHPACSPRR